jgi:hypothetical protein
MLQYKNVHLQDEVDSPIRIIFTSPQCFRVLMIFLQTGIQQQLSEADLLFADRWHQIHPEVCSQLE